MILTIQSENKQSYKDIEETQRISKTKYIYRNVTINHVFISIVKIEETLKTENRCILQKTKQNKLRKKFRTQDETNQNIRFENQRITDVNGTNTNGKGNKNRKTLTQNPYSVLVIS